MSADRVLVSAHEDQSGARLDTDVGADFQYWWRDSSGE
jgi:hypothetical protein